jgi:transposase
MAKGYSVDPRERVIAALQRGGMTEQAAEMFQIHEATIHRWKRLKRETGGLEPLPRGGGYPPRIAPEKEQLVREIIAAQPDATDQEAAWEFHRRTGTSVSRATMGRTLRELGLTRCWTTSARTGATASESLSRRRGLRSLYLPPYSPDLNPSSSAGARSRRYYVSLPHGHATPSTPRSAGRWTSSTSTTPPRGSQIAVIK